MLKWITKNVESPYGPVQTLHWAVPSDDDDDDEDDDDDDDSNLDHNYIWEHHHSNEQTHTNSVYCMPNSDDTDIKTEYNGKLSKNVRHALESAEDQLGAVLWNSNTMALNYLHKYIQHKCKQTQFYSIKEWYQSSRRATEDNYENNECQKRFVKGVKEGWDKQNLWFGCNVIELGAGVGCLGIALAMAGAHVVITDIKELFPLMKENIMLNAKNIREASNGIGECSAVVWKWGPSSSFKEFMTRVIMELEEQYEEPSSSSLSLEKLTYQNNDFKNDINSSRTENILSEEQEEKTKAIKKLLMPCITNKMMSEPSQPWIHSQEVLHSDKVHYIILCDALYGNPSDWPALLYTLTEILSVNNNAEECEIINFCEQRVNDVESGFLQLLDEQNKHICNIITDNNNCNNNEKSSICQNVNTLRNASRSFTWPEMNKNDKLKILNDVLAAKRAGYVWRYRVELLSSSMVDSDKNNNNTSELGMPIHVTHITWEKVESNALQIHEFKTHTKCVSSNNIENSITTNKSSKKIKSSKKRTRIASEQHGKSGNNHIISEQHHH